MQNYSTFLSEQQHRVLGDISEITPVQVKIEQVKDRNMELLLGQLEESQQKAQQERKNLYTLYQTNGMNGGMMGDLSAFLPSTGMESSTTDLLHAFTSNWSLKKSHHYHTSKSQIYLF